MYSVFRSDAIAATGKAITQTAGRVAWVTLLSSVFAFSSVAQDSDDEYEDEAPAAPVEEAAPAPTPVEEADDEGVVATDEVKDDSASEEPSANTKVNTAPTDSAFVGALDRLPRPGTPLIANKKHPMQYRLEAGVMGNISYANRFVAHYGANLVLDFHIFDWLAVEGFAGGFYPDEDGILAQVRALGVSGQNGNEPLLSGLWQSFAFGGAGVQWAPLYGKLSLASEIQLSFQFFFTGGVAVEGIAKVPNPTGVNSYDFYPGLFAGQTYDYWFRVNAMYGAGLRIMPLEWMAIRLELRNFTGLNPAVNEYEEVFDINNMPLVQAGLTFLL